MTDERAVAHIKDAMNDVVIPALKEYIRSELIPNEHERLFRQFCETRHERTIDALQRALAAILVVDKGSF